MTEQVLRIVRVRNLAIAALLAASASASAAKVAAQTGSVDVERSRLYVFVAKKGAGHEHGVEGRVAAGTIVLGNPRQAGTLTFDLRSLVADTSAARRFFNLAGETDADTQAKVNANMHGAAVLDLARFPTAEFRIDSALPTPQQADRPDQQPYELTGEFTLHGVKRALRIATVAEAADGLIRLRGRFPLKQTDYGITPFSKLLGAVGVGDEVQVFGDLWLRP